MNEASTTLRAGFGRASLTVFEPGMCMFGWGHPGNVCEGVATELYARAMAVEDPASGRRFVYVCCDLGMISESLRQAVVRRVCAPGSGLTEHDVMLTATHTHSGPSGFSTYFFYALSGPGVSPRVHDALADGVAAAVRAALAALRPARAWVHAGWIPATEALSFNRSIEAYNCNEDAMPVSWERRDEAVDRTMTVLRVDDEAGVPLGLVSWFPVHGTSVHSDYQRLHGDNKGCAARACEAWARERGHAGFVALFAQESAGDVTPNYRWSRSRGRMIGRYQHDEESAAAHGDAQSRHARALWSAAREDGEAVRGPVTTAIRYRDFLSLTPDARFGGTVDARTSAPRLGVAFAAGTLEGAGPLFPARRAMPLLTRVRARVVRGFPGDPWRVSQGNKFPFWDLGEGGANKVLGVIPVMNPTVHLVRTRSAGYYRDAMDWPFARRSWVPRYLPLQVVRFGPLVLAGLPIEPTTVAGRRMRAALADAWAGDGVTRVVINGYANAYCSYLTTPEEYDAQRYEGASTLYGRWSLPVYCTELAGLTREMRAGRAQASVGDTPPVYPLESCKAG
ncbi:MAG: neutral/alkaline non-lysosomal ceramidase N-terminal domain-containing protein [Deltaproteobacteria bacterium]|nr:neutral/alkaline non-lysosomal ceramidase N-terminal domain-containing protein [Myxococcales bacterium]MDP3213101.1 neutral/alkaline non-lysosomal ceramidase N-terminal domain-containing protein [Deltaproteobacteria bacterium]